MASPLPRAKKTVDLGAGQPRVSRIRRDPPPPPPRKVTAGELREREAAVIVTGIAAVGIALFVLLFEFSRVAGWSPADYEIRIEDRR